MEEPRRMDLVASLNVDVRGRDGSAIPVQAGEVVLFYFSAHWCPPCKQFTPMLANIHRTVSGEFGGKADSRYTATPPQPLHVIFVSSDKSDAEMKAYMAESHGNWSYVSFGSSGVATLSQHFRVQGIPSVQVCSPNGTPVVSDARMEVMQGQRDPLALLQRWQMAAGVRFDVLPNGVRVKLHSLKKADLNGELGYVTGVDLTNDRVKVRLPSGKTVALRRDVCAQFAIGSLKGEMIELSPDDEGLYLRDGELITETDFVPGPGTVVRIEGLQSKPEKNGTWGTATGYDDSSGRVLVKVSPNEVLKLKPGNCRL